MKGAEGFDRSYAELYGDRWPTLRAALLRPPAAVAFRIGTFNEYYLDAASVIAAACLEVGPADRVLDLCAAPGGKSVVLASALAHAGSTGSLTCNERSATRRARLHRVLAECLPPETHARVRVTGHDATRWAVFEPAAYDRVLADVPCSSERHVIQSPEELEKWGPTRTKRLAQGAYAIGCAGADALREGGRMVYATCTLSAEENDRVVERLLARRKGASMRLVAVAPIVDKLVAGARALTDAAGLADPVSLALSGLSAVPGSATDSGWMILPDDAEGLGPMYFSVLERGPCLSG